MKATTPDASPASKTRQLIPSWDHELELQAKGLSIIAGVDEAGRGAWAGPLVAAAVVFPDPDLVLARVHVDEVAAELSLLRDSKMIPAHVREQLLEVIKETACAVGVGVVSSGLIDVIGVGPANRLAMARAVRDLGVWPDFLLIDAFKIHSMPIPQRPIIKGDATCMTIAAASVVAKVARDRIMCELEGLYPGYGFAQHKGYGTRSHVESLLRLGVSPVHRRCFAPIGALLAGEEVCADA
jgi:ribonuclease HII